MFTIIFRLIDSFFTVFYILIFVHIIISWIPSLRQSSLAHLVYSLTNPYLSAIRRIFPLVFYGMDFSIIIAIGLLNLLQSLFHQIALTGHIDGFTFIYFFFSLISTVINAFFMIIIVLSLVRFLTLLIFKGVTGPFSAMCDRFLFRPISFVAGILPLKGRRVHYSTMLILVAIFSFIVSRGLHYLLNIFYAFIRNIFTV